MSDRVIVIKVGTNVLTDARGAPDVTAMQSLVAALACLRQAGARLIFVSSGAMGFGQAHLAPTRHQPASAVAERQLFAAVGQVTLMRQYAELFAHHELTVAQVLATKQDFADREHYLTMRQCFETLLAAGVIPIVNENDAVSVSELMFTDNDELAGLVAAMLNADRLLLLTNVDGLYTGQPGKSALIQELVATDSVDHIATGGSSAFGRGGMRTKLALARRLANLGIEVQILNGKRPERLSRAARGERVGTIIRPAGRRSSTKRRLRFADQEARMTVTVNDGAYQRLRAAEPASLLPIGITAIDGHCQKGDLVRLATSDGTFVGIGRAEYGSDQLAAKLGARNQRAFIHYNYLVMYE